MAKLYATQGAKDAAIRSCNAILAVNSQDQEALALRASLDHAVAREHVPAQNQPTVEFEKTGKRQSDRPGAEPLSSGVGGDAPVAGNDGDDHLAPIQPSLTEGAAQSRSHQRIDRSAVVRLEQWLRLIQARRRDVSAPPQSVQKTSV